MIIKIPGIPLPLKRHRSFLRGGKINQYDPQIKEKILFQKKLRVELCEKGVITELLSKEKYYVHLSFFMPFPKSKLRKDTVVKDIPHNKKPDLDNLIKFVLDCGNGLMWLDDSKIVFIKACKEYGTEPHTIIEIL
jgi:Holliday junction resolvase RusA-like endonuclease